MIALKNTIELAKSDIKLNDFRVLQAILCGLKPDRVAPPNKYLKDILGTNLMLDYAIENLLNAGILEIDDQDRLLVPERFVSFYDSSGIGVVPILQDRLRQFAQGDLKLGDLKLFYYLLGGLKKRNVIPDFKNPKVAKELGYVRWAIWTARNNLIRHKILVVGEKLTISKLCLGMEKKV